MTTIEVLGKPFACLGPLEGGRLLAGRQTCFRLYSFACRQDADSETLSKAMPTKIEKCKIINPDWEPDAHNLEDIKREYLRTRCAADPQGGHAYKPLPPDDELLSWHRSGGLSLEPEESIAVLSELVDNPVVQMTPAEATALFAKQAKLEEARQGIVEEMLGCVPANPECFSPRLIAASIDAVKATFSDGTVLLLKDAAEVPMPADFDAFLMSAKGETSTKSFQEWAGGERVTLAIVFTDVVGSTALGEEIRDEAMNEVRRAHFARSRQLIGQFEGREIKTIGDSFMVAFKCADAALDYALALRGNTGHPRVEIRVGMHIGSMQVEEDDVGGRTVAFAARVIEAVEGAEIWLSERAKEDVDQLGAGQHKHLKWERHEGVAMKGFPGAFTLWSLKS